MVHIHHRIGIKAKEEHVYLALATKDGISGWWTRDSSEKDGNLHLRFLTPEGEEKGIMEIEVLELCPSQKIHWKFRNGPAEWIDTEVIFELKKEENFTIVLFSHLHWKEEVEFKSHCSMKWATFLLSLRQFVETGTGNPAPFDVKIDNWN